MILGDLLTNGSYPIIDESSGGSSRGMIQAIAQILPLLNADTVVVPGHGAIGNRSTLLGFRDMLLAIVFIRTVLAGLGLTGKTSKR